MKGKLLQQQNLTQQQRLTPMQVQFVRMLEMTGPELEQTVKRSLEEMPALERADDVTPETPTTTDESAYDGDSAFNETAEQLQMADYSNDEEIPSYRLNVSNASPDEPSFTPQTADTGETLFDILESQLSELDLPEPDRALADYIIGNFDDNGYLTRPIQSIADDVAFNLGIDVSAEHLQNILDAIRTLDPAGVGATDLRDCLLLQADRRPASQSVEDARTILRRHFELFAHRHFERLAETTGFDRQRLEQAVKVITRLDPKPGNVASDSDFENRSRQIVPELELTTDGGNMTLTLLDNIPELTIAGTFASDPEPGKGKSARALADAVLFVRNRREEASLFIKTLKLRQQTLFNVASAIVGFQRQFFLTGDKTTLRPMGLKDIATATGYDLSVISRATATKYILTPTGVYPLKFFFNEKTASGSGADDATFHTVAEAIRHLIDTEDKSAPLSDEALTQALAKDGFDIARRTVAKYRERLGFPVARLRRQLTD